MFNDVWGVKEGEEVPGVIVSKIVLKHRMELR